MNTLEDAGGYFCGVCGRDSCTPEACKPIVRFTDINWHAVLVTLDDAAGFSDSSRKFRYNQTSRLRELDKLQRFCDGYFRDDRIAHAHARWTSECDWDEMCERWHQIREAVEKLRAFVDEKCRGVDGVFEILSETEAAGKI